MNTRRLAGVLAIGALQPMMAASAQRARGGAPRSIGVALSGGAARGLAHIGVLKVLAEAGIPVDMIAGTSMGSIVGGLYATGYTPADLEHIAETEDWVRLLTDVAGRRDLPVGRKSAADQYAFALPIVGRRVRLPRSVVAGQRISQVLTRLTWPVHAVRDFRALPVPFAAVATDLETGSAVVLDHGFLADAIRASMAMPSVFAPVTLDGRVLIDGGVVRNLPAQDARALGADVLICSDVTDPLEPRDSVRTFVDVLIQSVSFRIWDAERQERKLCDVLIDPNVHGFASFGFERIPEVIARGEAAARAALPQIEALVSGTAGSPRGRPGATEPESVYVRAIHFDSLGRVPRHLVARALGFRAPRWVTRRRLDAAIDRVYATGLFASVHYRLQPAADSASDARELAILVKERTEGRFGLGLRYESRYKASVLLSAAVGGIAGFGSEGEARVRLGQQIQLGLGVSRSVQEGGTVRVGLQGDYVRSPFDLYDGSHRVAQARVDLGRISASMARTLGTSARLAWRLEAEHAAWDDEVSAVNLPPIRRTIYGAAGELEVDTYDRGAFPSRGLRLRALSEWGGRLAGEGRVFSHQFADLHASVPVLPGVSLWSGVTVGASGGDPPPHYLFFLGGANTYYLFPDRDIPFVGLQTQQRRGRQLQKVEVGAQWEFLPNVFGLVRWNAGNVYDRWIWDPSGYVTGVSLELGAATRAGTAHLSVSGRGSGTWPSVQIDLGYPF
jgi:NTE family protein